MSILFDSDEIWNWMNILTQDIDNGLPNWRINVRDRLFRWGDEPLGSKKKKGYLTHHTMMFMFSHHVQTHLIFESLELSDIEKDYWNHVIWDGINRKFKIILQLSTRTMSKYKIFRIIQKRWFEMICQWICFCDSKIVDVQISRKRWGSFSICVWFGNQMFFFWKVLID